MTSEQQTAFINVQTTAPASVPSAPQVFHQNDNRSGGKEIGRKPDPFSGDKTETENFLNDLDNYFLLNPHLYPPVMKLTLAT